jgi:hypothetical protein
MRASPENRHGPALLSRRSFAATMPAVVAASALAGCDGTSAPGGHAEATRTIWRHGPLRGLAGAALSEELVRYATLAPSSHNTQCWTFSLAPGAITILPDLGRRCPAVDPDDHHLFVSLGCAAENLVLAARAHGLRSEVAFDAPRGAVQVALVAAPAVESPLFQAIPHRQCTRAEYDGQPLAAAELKALEAAGTTDTVRVQLLTDKPALETVLGFVLQGNSAQMRDPAFVRELKAWVRFSESQAVRAGDGLFAKSSGNPTLPSWLGGLLFDIVFTESSENDKYARQLRSSAGVAVFSANQAGPASWVEVGRAYERFALQATALGIRNAHVNMPVEVAALRAPFAAAIGLGASRPDLVVRVGRGPLLPPSLRRPVRSVIV